ncbi:hypothetical protein BDZ91DRAFT_233174 [Kalaharituber pfeilii]|nr:hypothetical protein BDZ91DRAFT_233174 [Kalaharituber pfeilii]
MVLGDQGEELDIREVEDLGIEVVVEVGIRMEPMKLPHRMHQLDPAVEGLEVGTKTAAAGSGTVASMTVVVVRVVGMVGDMVIGMGTAVGIEMVTVVTEAVVVGVMVEAGMVPLTTMAVRDSTREKGMVVEAATLEGEGIRSPSLSLVYRNWVRGKGTTFASVSEREGRGGEWIRGSHRVGFLCFVCRRYGHHHYRGRHHLYIVITGLLLQEKCQRRNVKKASGFRKGGDKIVSPVSYHIFYVTSINQLLSNWNEKWSCQICFPLKTQVIIARKGKGKG